MAVEAGAGDAALGDHTTDGEHGKAAVGDLLERVLIGVARLHQLERVEAVVTRDAALEEGWREGGAVGSGGERWGAAGRCCAVGSGRQ